ncbi:MAG TPA: ABC transporter permease, partial [Stackebrandtia sp.]|uniref:ABC transporter permease n=1 Tax=Stackebrandtia sp. TaxID=2023065 RepID=UPI002D62E405
MTRLWRPALSMARDRWGGLIAVACAVAGGAAMATATGVVVETGVASHAPVQRLAAADVLVSGGQYVVQDADVDVTLPDRVPVDAGLVDEIAKLPGVDRAVGDVSFPASMASSDAHADTAGHGWGAAALGGSLADGRQPSAKDEVALDSDAAATARVGDDVTLSVNGVAGKYRVSGIVDAPGTGLYFADTTARHLAKRDAGAGEGTVDLVAVRTAHPSAVAERIRAAVAGAHLVVTTGAERGDIESLAAGAGRGTLIAIASSLGGTIVLIVGFIVAGALSVSVAGQRRELALLRAIGATPRQVRRLIATQAGVVAAAAMPIGIAAGYLLAQWFADLLAATGEVPSNLPTHLGPLPAVAAAVLLLGVVQVAARLAAGRTSRMAATEAVAESRVEPRDPAPLRVTIGFALMGLALASTVVPLISRSEAAFISVASGILPAMIGLALAAPSIVRAVTGRLKRRMRPSGRASTWLAVANSHGYALRMAGAITVLALAVGFAITQVFSQSTLRAVADDDLAEGSHVDVSVSASALGGLTDDDVRQIGALTGVRAAVPTIATSAVWPYREDGKRRADAVPMLALGSGAASVIDADVASGDMSRLRGDTVAVDAATAWTEDLSVGDHLDLFLANGARVSPTIVATYRRGF